MLAQTHLPDGLFGYFQTIAVAGGLFFLLVVFAIIAAIGQRPLSPFLIPALVCPAIGSTTALVVGLVIRDSGITTFVSIVPAIVLCIVVYQRADEIVKKGPPAK